MKTTTKRKKLLFQGLFNYGRQVEKCFAWAYTSRQARVYMLKQLATRHGVNFSAVKNIFNGDKQNFNIAVDPEWQEKQ